VRRLADSLIVPLALAGFAAFVGGMWTLEPILVLFAGVSLTTACLLKGTGGRTAHE
jgi:hypothetical protein